MQEGKLTADFCSDVIYLGLETAINNFFEVEGSSHVGSEMCLRRVFVDYFFYVGFWGKVMLKGFLSIFGMRMPFFSWAGRSVWYDRSVGIAEAAGSNPAPSTLLIFKK